jgi:hypothetical protein
MSYTRVFDASDADLVAIWRDDLETTGDQRSGDWEARLFWSENFIRFSTKLMIVEMFQLHGGEAKRRIIFKPRKYK